MDYPPVIIIGGGSGNGLGITRNLGSLGIPVYCLTSNPFELSQYSKYCTSFTHVPDIERNPASLQQALEKLYSRLPATGVLFPTTDTVVLTLARVRNSLPPYLMNQSSRDVLETMVIKTRFYQSLRQWNIPHPLTLFPEEIDATYIRQHMSFPLYLRPAQSLLFHQQFHQKGFVVHNAHELQTLLQHTQRRHLQMMVQDIIPGPTTNGYVIRGYFDQHSRPLALFATQKIRQPQMFANNCVKLSIPLTPIASSVEKLVQYLKGIRYRGLFGAEYKRDTRDEELKLLEINARSMGGNIFPARCGVNHIRIAYQDIIGQPVKPLPNPQYGMYGINLIYDTAALVTRGVAGHLTTPDFVPYIRQKYWSRFSIDDPLPFFQSIHHLIRAKFTRSRR